MTKYNGRRVALSDGRRGTVMWPANFDYDYPSSEYPGREFYDGRKRNRLVGYRVKLDAGGHALVPEGAVEFLDEDVA